MHKHTLCAAKKTLQTMTQQTSDVCVPISPSWDAARHGLGMLRK